MSGGRLRTVWRLVAYVALFFAFLWSAGLLLPFVAGLEIPEDRISLGLVVQTGLVLLAALLAAWVMLRWIDRRPLRGLGFPISRGALRELAIGVAVGAGALAVVVGLGVLLGWYRYAPEAGSLGGWAGTAGLALVALAVPAAAEEALIRGYPLRALVEGPGATLAVILTSLVFAALHGNNPGIAPIALLNLFLAGVLLGVAVVRTGTLWLATGVHLGWNWVMSGPLDLPVSGLAGLDMPLYDVAVAGPAWVTGGSFGPEGGLVGTLAACLAVAVVIRVTARGAVLDRAVNV